MTTLGISTCNTPAHEMTEKQSVIANPFLVPFFNFFYYLLLIPFKTVLNASGEEYILKVNLPQQIFCGVVHIGAFVVLNFIAVEGILQIKSNDASNIVACFDFGTNMSTSMAALCLLHILWKRRKDYLHVINITRCKFSSHRKLRAAQMLIYIILGALLLFFGILDWYIVQEKSTDEILHLTYGEAWYKSVLQQSTLKNVTNDKEDSGNSSLENHNATNKGNHFSVKSCFMYFFLLYLTQFFIICQATFLTLVLTLRQLGREFISDMQANCFGNADGITKGLEMYQNMKVVTDQIRQLFGNALVGFYISAIAYYAEAPHVLLGTRGEAERSIMIYFVISGVTWLIAAEFHFDVRDCILKWVEQHIDRHDLNLDSRLRLQGISGEISSNDVIALSSKWFSVTYKHIGSMLGLVVTYGIIVFQLHPSHPRDL